MKYNRDFELIKEEHAGTLGVNDNFYYKYDETTQTLNIIGADVFELYTAEDGSKYAKMPDYTVKKVLFRNCTFSDSLCGLLGQYKDSVEEVVFENCDTEDVTDMSQMFAGCRKLTTLDFGDFDTSSVIDVSEMFFNCQKLSYIDISSFRLQSGCNTNNMFSDNMCIETIHTPYVMYNDVEIVLPYCFVDEDGNILTSITSEHRNKIIYVYKTEPNVGGDVNDDGEVNNLDRQILTRYLANWDGYNEDMINMKMADLNGDGEVNNLDRQILTRHLANWEGYEQLPYLN